MLQVTIILTINSHYWLQVYQLTFYHVVMKCTPAPRFSCGRAYGSLHDGRRHPVSCRDRRNWEKSNSSRRWPGGFHRPTEGSVCSSMDLDSRDRTSILDALKEWERASKSASKRTCGRAVSTDASFTCPAVAQPSGSAHRSRKPHLAEWTQWERTCGRTWQTRSLCRRHQRARRRPWQRKASKPFPSRRNKWFCSPLSETKLGRQDLRPLTRTSSVWQTPHTSRSTCIIISEHNWDWTCCCVRILLRDQDGIIHFYHERSTRSVQLVLLRPSAVGQEVPEVFGGWPNENAAEGGGFDNGSLGQGHKKGDLGAPRGAPRFLRSCRVVREYGGRDGVNFWASGAGDDNARSWVHFLTRSLRRLAFQDVTLPSCLGCFVKQRNQQCLTSCASCGRIDAVNVTLFDFQAEWQHLKDGLFLHPLYQRREFLKTCNPWVPT